MSLDNKILWSTQSNALLRSMNVAIATFFWSNNSRISSENFNRACSVLAPDLKPNWDVLRWFGQLMRMDEYCMASRVLIAEVSGGQVQDGLRLGWVDGVKVALGDRRN